MTHEEYLELIKPHDSKYDGKSEYFMIGVRLVERAFRDDELAK